MLKLYIAIQLLLALPCRIGWRTSEYNSRRAEVQLRGTGEDDCFDFTPYLSLSFPLTNESGRRCGIALKSHLKYTSDGFPGDPSPLCPQQIVRSVLRTRAAF